MNSTLTIVTLSHRNNELLLPWLNYHLSFANVMLFLDQHAIGTKEISPVFEKPRQIAATVACGPGRRGNLIIKKFKDLLNVQSNDPLVLLLHNSSVYKLLFETLNSEVQARQTAVAKYASLYIQHSTNHGSGWLVHIDTDELLWSENGRFFDAQDDKHHNLVLLNYEIVHKPAVDTVAIRNPFIYYRQFKTRLTRESFIGYRNGKGAVFISSATDKIKPNGVHRWMLRRQNGFIVAPQLSKFVRILHFLDYSFDAWLKKYRLLGRFSDSYRLGPTEPLQQRIMSHALSRDVIVAAEEAEQNQDLERAYNEIHRADFNWTGVVEININL